MKKAIQETFDLENLFKEYGFTIPFELPNVNVGIILENGKLTFRVEYDEEEIENIEDIFMNMSETEMQMYLLEIALAAKRVENKYQQELEELKRKVM